MEKPDFTKFYNQHRTPLMNYIMGRFNRSKEVAEELTNDVLMKAHKNYSNFNPQKGELFKWICSVAFQVTIDHIRTDKRKHFANVNDFVGENGETYLEPSNPVDALTEIERSELKTDIKGAFSKLSTNNRKVAILRFIDGFSYEDIAQILEIPLNTVCVTVKRSRAKLTEHLTPVLNVT